MGWFPSWLENKDGFRATYELYIGHKKWTTTSLVTSQSTLVLAKFRML